MSFRVQPKVGPDLRGLRRKFSIQHTKNFLATEGRTRFEGIETYPRPQAASRGESQPKVGPDLRGLRLFNIFLTYWRLILEPKVGPDLRGLRPSGTVHSVHLANKPKVGPDLRGLRHYAVDQSNQYTE